MFNFFKKPDKKPIIIAIHGFGKRRTDQLIPLKTYFENAGYEVRCPILFDSRDERDCQGEQWIQRAQNAVEQALSEQRTVILFGFSMGGVIASYLASILPVSKLILLAPAFSYLTLGNVTSTVTRLFQSDDPLPDAQGNPALPASFTAAFRSVVDHHKDSLSQVRCPILIFHGTEDETIPCSSSRRIIHKVSHSHRALILLYEAGHHLLDDELHRGIILETSRALIENRL